MLAGRIAPSVSSSARGLGRQPCSHHALGGPLPRRVSTPALALDDTNLALNVLSSLAACTVVAGVTLATSETRDRDLEKLQELDTWTVAPLGAAVVADAVLHSVPLLNVVYGLLAEPLGAAAGLQLSLTLLSPPWPPALLLSPGVAYMMTLVLSAPAVDPATLAPKGTVLNAEKATDSRGSLRVPFTRLVSTAIKVVDLKNEASSGAGWSIGESGLPRLPINSVLIVLGVGGVILEAASHAPVLSTFMPRVLQVAACLAATGYAVEYFKLGDQAKA
ncbi:hypothetical protein QJQ45_002128 [Haematococcus lacustris]|nr:hypothetical protein QJQ45_002128 [Haematococcus lacustris]